MFSRPRLSRVTPMSRMARTLASVRVPGSHSKATSSTADQEKASFIRTTSPRSCFGLMNDGVPPPK